MKNKKGFTLVEIIACLAILAVIGVTSFVAIRALKKNEEEETKKQFIESVKLASGIFIDKNDTLDKFKDLKNEGDYTYIQLKDLVEIGLMDENELNPFNSKTLKEQNCDLVKVYVDDVGSWGIVYPLPDYENASCKEYEELTAKYEIYLVNNNKIGNTVYMKTSTEIYEEYLKDKKIFDKINSGKYYENYYKINDGTYYLKNMLTGEKVLTTSDDWSNSCDYIKPEGNSNLPYWECIYSLKKTSKYYDMLYTYEPVKRIVSLVDNSAPILINYSIYGIESFEFIDPVTREKIVKQMSKEGINYYYDQSQLDVTNNTISEHQYYAIVNCSSNGCSDNDIVHYDSLAGRYFNYYFDNYDGVIVDIKKYIDSSGNYNLFDKSGNGIVYSPKRISNDIPSYKIDTKTNKYYILEDDKIKVTTVEAFKNITNLGLDGGITKIVSYTDGGVCKNSFLLAKLCEKVGYGNVYNYSCVYDAEKIYDENSGAVNGDYVLIYSVCDGCSCPEYEIPVNVVIENANYIDTEYYTGDCSAGQNSSYEYTNEESYINESGQNCTRFITYRQSVVCSCTAVDDYQNNCKWTDGGSEIISSSSSTCSTD